MTKSSAATTSLVSSGPQDAPEATNTALHSQAPKQGLAGAVRGAATTPLVSAPQGPAEERRGHVQQGYQKRQHGGVEACLSGCVKLCQVCFVKISGFFVFIGWDVMRLPLEKSVHYAEDSCSYHYMLELLFWKTQGFLLMWFGVLASFSMLYFGVCSGKLGSLCKCCDIFFGTLQYEFGRSLYCVLVGVYITPLSRAFEQVANVEHWLGDASRWVGIISVSDGVVLFWLYALLWCVRLGSKDKYIGERSEDDQALLTQP